MNTDALAYYQSHEEQVLFSTRVKRGNGSQEVIIAVPAETLVEFARVYALSGHAGHAAWHMKNPQAQLPCESCHPSCVPFMSQDRFENDNGATP